MAESGFSAFQVGAGSADAGYSGKLFRVNEVLTETARS